MNEIDLVALPHMFQYNISTAPKIATNHHLEKRKNNISILARFEN